MARMDPATSRRMTARDDAFQNCHSARSRGIHPDQGGTPPRKQPSSTSAHGRPPLRNIDCSTVTSPTRGNRLDPSPKDLVVARPEGLYCPAGDFHIDPWQPVGHA